LLPDNIAELLAAALTPFGYEPTEEHHRLVSGEGETYWREVNDTALKNLPAWVPDLRLPGTKKHGKGYRVLRNGVASKMPTYLFTPKASKTGATTNRIRRLTLL